MIWFDVFPAMARYLGWPWLVVFGCGASYVIVSAVLNGRKSTQGKPVDNSEIDPNP